ncbi:MAG: hypothetical protein FWF06_06070 [Symbiobacteriaceae bacterium]|nr:hypothetical protein [Symbiobacteriaceae bacterium]
MTVVRLDPLVSLALAVLVYFGGSYLTARVAILKRYCIPAAVVGGTLFALGNLAGYLSGILLVEFDLSLQLPAMSAFFATVGLMAGMANRKHHRIQGTGALFILSIILVVAQNIIALGVALATGLSPGVGFLAGSASLVGGFGTVIPLAQVLTEVGVTAATTVGASAATFGLLAGSALGGPLALWLLKGDKEVLKGSTSTWQVDLPTPEENYDLVATTTEELGRSQHLYFLQAAALIIFLMAGSSLVAGVLEVWLPTLKVPPSVAAMLLGLLTGQILAGSTAWGASPGGDQRRRYVELIGELMLIIFLALSAISLQLWELLGMAFPLLLILLAQLVFITLFILGAVYPVMTRSLGSRYEAAVVCSGLCGFGLGAMANAMANMDALTRRYGEAPLAYLIIPLVGSLLIDMVNIPLLLLLVNIIA